MAPKAQKRVAPDTKKNTAVKKTRSETTEDPLMASIIETIELAEALPQACRNMLISGVRGSLRSSLEERHQVQVTIFSMVDEVVKARDALLADAVASAQTAVATADTTKAQLAASLETAQESLAEKSKVLEEKMSATSLAAERMVAANASLAEKQELQKTGDAQMEHIQQNKAKVENSIATDVKQLLAGESNGKDLMLMLHELKFDDSLLTALPATCAKAAADRGDFDGMVLQQLETSLQQKLESLCKNVEDEVPLAKARSEAAAVAQEDAASASSLHAQATDEQAGAEAAKVEAGVCVEKASKSLVAHGPEEHNAVARHEENVAALEAFRQNTLIPFEALCNGFSATVRDSGHAEGKLAVAEKDSMTGIIVGGA